MKFMKIQSILLACILNFSLLGTAAARADDMVVAVSESLSNSNKLFDWAEINYPQFFNPSGAQTFEIAGYLARYYSNTNIYLGTLGNDVYVYGDLFGGLLKVGKISDYVTVNSKPTVVDNFPKYQYRALGIGGDTVDSKAKITINGVDYTVFAMSETKIKNPSIGGDFTTAFALINGNKLPQITLGVDYLKTQVVLKVYSSNEIFNSTTFSGESKSTLMTGSYVDFGNIIIKSK